MKKLDAIFIGSGHNALIAAAYLARAGWRVLVLEKNDRPGGLVRTEEVTLPGFKHDLYSSAQPLFVTSQAYAELGPELAERGLQYVNTDLPTGVSVSGLISGSTGEPTISFDAPSILDPTRVPEGKATLRLQMLEVPVRPRGDAAGTIDVGDGTWTEDLKRRFADRVLDIVGRHVPNVPGAVLGLHVISPDDLARFSPNQGPGDPYGGSHDIAQSYLFRPLPSQPSHRTAVPNVYMLGAATWPGHGVNGGSGYIVAQQLLAGGQP